MEENDERNKEILPSRRRRSPEEVATERREIEEDTARAIDLIVGESRLLLPRDQAKSIGALYARYSSRDQDSVPDQVRILIDVAVKQGIFVPREFVFYDLAVRGYKNKRPGLDALRELLAATGVAVLLVFATNRLFRKTYRALQFVHEETYARGIRCIFARSGVDTADEAQWRTLLNLHALIDEQSGGMYGPHIQAAQEGLFAKRMFSGTSIPYGYKGEDVPGQFTRRGTPRLRLAIDADASLVVEKIFRWYADDNLSMADIVRRLNADPSVPLAVYNTTGEWSSALVRTILRRTCYRGHWEFGRTKTVWDPRKDANRQIRREVPIRQEQWEDLRIVSDELWFRVQPRLDEELRRSAGRKPRDINRRFYPRALNGMLFCATHGTPLLVGNKSKRLYCADCRKETVESRPLFTNLNRVTALVRTCQVLADLVRRDESLVQTIIECCRGETEVLARPDPSRLTGLKSRRELLTRKIRKILANLGEEQDREESGTVLAEQRRERRSVDDEIQRMEAALRKPIAIPSEEEVRELLDHFEQTLVAAGRGEVDVDGGEAREIIRMLTGGRIELVQQGLRQQNRGWLQGRFRLRLIASAMMKAGGSPPVDPPEEPEVVIDYVASTRPVALADRAKFFYDKGLLIGQIAERLGVGRDQVTAALKHWHDRHGMPMVDGRLRRLRMSAQAYADRAGALYEQGLLAKDIAISMGICTRTVTRALKVWGVQHGKPIVNYRIKHVVNKDSVGPYPLRDALAGEIKDLWDEGLRISEIAERKGMKNNSVIRLLKHWHERHGMPMVSVRRHFPFAEIYERVKALRDEGHPLTKIAGVLKISRHAVTESLRFWHERHGVPMEKIRSWDLPNPVRDAHVDRVKELYDQGVRVRDISKQLGIGMAMLYSALKHWHELRGLVWTRSRQSRRRPMAVIHAELANALRAQGKSHEAIARQLGISRPTVASALRYWQEQHGGWGDNPPA